MQKIWQCIGLSALICIGSPGPAGAQERADIEMLRLYQTQDSLLARYYDRAQTLAARYDSRFANSDYDLTLSPGSVAALAPVIDQSFNEVFNSLQDHRAARGAIFTRNDWIGYMYREAAQNYSQAISGLWALEIALARSEIAQLESQFGDACLTANARPGAGMPASASDFYENLERYRGPVDVLFERRRTDAERALGEALDRYDRLASEFAMRRADLLRSSWLMEAQLRRRGETQAGDQLRALIYQHFSRDEVDDRTANMVSTLDIFMSYPGSDDRIIMNCLVSLYDRAESIGEFRKFDSALSQTVTSYRPGHDLAPVQTSGSLTAQLTQVLTTRTAAYFRAQGELGRAWTRLEDDAIPLERLLASVRQARASGDAARTLLGQLQPEAELIARLEAAQARLEESQAGYREAQNARELLTELVRRASRLREDVRVTHSWSGWQVTEAGGSSPSEAIAALRVRQDRHRTNAENYRNNLRTTPRSQRAVIQRRIDTQERMIAELARQIADIQTLAAPRPAPSAEETAAADQALEEARRRLDQAASEVEQAQQNLEALRGGRDGFELAIELDGFNRDHIAPLNLANRRLPEGQSGNERFRAIATVDTAAALSDLRALIEQIAALEADLQEATLAARTRLAASLARQREADARLSELAIRVARLRDAASGHIKNTSPMLGASASAPLLANLEEYNTVATQVRYIVEPVRDMLGAGLNRDVANSAVGDLLAETVIGGGAAETIEDALSRAGMREINLAGPDVTRLRETYRRATGPLSRVVFVQANLSATTSVTDIMSTLRADQTSLSSSMSYLEAIANLGNFTPISQNIGFGGELGSFYVSYIGMAISEIADRAEEIDEIILGQALSFPSTSPSPERHLYLSEAEMQDAFAALRGSQLTRALAVAQLRRLRAVMTARTLGQLCDRSTNTDVGCGGPAVGGRQ